MVDTTLLHKLVSWLTKLQFPLYLNYIQLMHSYVLTQGMIHMY